MAKETMGDREISPTDLLRAVLLNQKNHLHDLIQRLGTEENPPPNWGADVPRIIRPMLVGIEASLQSVLRLTEMQDMGVRDLYGIARALHELAVNVAYIAATGRETALLAERHAFQKHYRTLGRNGQLRGRHEMPETAALAEALAEFTNKKKSEIADWIKGDMASRITTIRKIDHDAALCLSGSLSSIQKTASEISHGSYYGVHYFWCGSNGLSPSERSFAEIWDEHFARLFSTTFSATQGVLRLFAKLLDRPALYQSQIEAEDYVEGLVRPV
jgi:hypothetical protein